MLNYWPHRNLIWFCFPQMPVLPSLWVCLGEQYCLGLKTHHVFIVIIIFVRATLILHGWSWLSTTFMYRLFCQDLSSQTSVFLLSQKTSMK